MITGSGPTSTTPFAGMEGGENPPRGCILLARALQIPLFASRGQDNRDASYPMDDTMLVQRRCGNPVDVPSVTSETDSSE